MTVNVPCSGMMIVNIPFSELMVNIPCSGLMVNVPCSGLMIVNAPCSGLMMVNFPRICCVVEQNLSRCSTSHSCK